jgi:ribosome recycling factor
MSINDIYSYTKEHMEKSIDSLKKDFSSLRTGRVSANVVDNIKVDYWGNPTALSQVGQVTVSDASTIMITPWEKNLLKEIEKAIQIANIGVTPNNDGEKIRLSFPPMTSEQRKDTAKKAKDFAEKAKVAVRNIRRDANDKVKKLEKDKAVSEDDAKKAQDHIQKITDEFIKKIDDTLSQKENDILKV